MDTALANQYYNVTALVLVKLLKDCLKECRSVCFNKIAVIVMLFQDILIHYLIVVLVEDILGH